jgi:2-aminoadipate transaminase
VTKFPVVHFWQGAVRLFPMRPQGIGFKLSQRACRTTEQPISYLMQAAVEQPGLISLAAGLVDYETLPGPSAAELLDDLLGDPARSRIAMQYGTTQGLAELRHAVLDHMASLDGVRPDDLAASPDDVVISTGSQQLLFTITDVLVDPGDIVITERPTYFVYTGVLRTLGADVRGVDMDEQGMDPAALDEMLGRIAREGNLSRVKIVYLCDYHQNPTGLTLAADRRRAIVEIVQRYSANHRILLLEDAAYRELTYLAGPLRGPGPDQSRVAARPGIPSIKSFDPENRHVALLQTFSKPFAPGVKTGYGLLPRDLVEPVLLQKGSHDFGSANLCQHLLLAAMKRGVYHEHVNVLCEHYAKKRDAMLAALEEYLGDVACAHWTRPSGGLYVWVTLPEQYDTAREGPLFSRAIAEGVLYVPGVYCYGDAEARPAPINTMRLSFGVSTIEQIHEGIARLARAIKAG